MQPSPAFQPSPPGQAATSVSSQSCIDKSCRISQSQVSKPCNRGFHITQPLHLASDLKIRRPTSPIAQSESSRQDSGQWEKAAAGSGPITGRDWACKTGGRDLWIIRWTVLPRVQDYLSSEEFRALTDNTLPLDQGGSGAARFSHSQDCLEITPFVTGRKTEDKEAGGDRENRTN